MSHPVVDFDVILNSATEERVNGQPPGLADEIEDGHLERFVGRTGTNAAGIPAIGTPPEEVLQSDGLRVVTEKTPRPVAHVLDRLSSARFTQTVELGIGVEPDDLLPTAISQAVEIAANPSTSVSVIKRMMMEDMLTTDLSTVMRRSDDNFATGRKTAEHREALLALGEKRSARFHDAAHMAEVAASLTGD